MSASDLPNYFTGNGTYKAINPLVSRVGDFTPFYIAIAICSVILGLILILNVVCCCSRYSDYWLDRNTGNLTIHYLPKEALRSRYVCIDHFEPGCIQNEHGIHRRLNKSEVPVPCKGNVTPTLSMSPVASTSHGQSGNRWIVSIWSATPHKQPPLDFTELENNYQPVRYIQPYSTGYHEEHARGDVPPSVSTQPLTSSQEFLELHKRESDI